MLAVQVGSPKVGFPPKSDISTEHSQISAYPSYSSWWRSQYPGSLRPFGARSSH